MGLARRQPRLEPRCRPRAFPRTGAKATDPLARDRDVVELAHYVLQIGEPVKVPVGVLCAKEGAQEGPVIAQLSQCLAQIVAGSRALAGEAVAALLHPPGLTVEKGRGMRGEALGPAPLGVLGRGILPPPVLEPGGEPDGQPRIPRRAHRLENVPPRLVALREGGCSEVAADALGAWCGCHLRLPATGANREAPGCG